MKSGWKVPSQLFFKFINSRLVYLALCNTPYPIHCVNKFQISKLSLNSSNQNCNHSFTIEYTILIHMQVYDFHTTSGNSNVKYLTFKKLDEVHNIWSKLDRIVSFCNCSLMPKIMQCNFPTLVTKSCSTCFHKVAIFTCLIDERDLYSTKQTASEQLKTGTPCEKHC